MLRASLLLGLAPDGGYLAARVTTSAGGLLHHLFTFAAHPSPPLQAGEGQGGGAVCFSVALFRRVTLLWMIAS
jgi:hypothetical protein